jgi:head-tail adaptor
VAIGDYPDRLTIRTRATSTESTFGQKEPAFSDGSAAWGRVEEGSGSKRSGDNQFESRAEATITLRGRVTISASDRIRDERTGYEYRVEGVTQSIAETTLSAFRLTG